VTPRRPSFRKSFAARTSFRRLARQRLGLRAPRGWGWLTNPRKAAYNRVYRRTTFSMWPRRSRAGLGCCVPLAFVLAGLAGLAAVLFKR
jgi:hypothetical protein